MDEGRMLVIALFVFGGASLLFYVGYWIHRFITVTNRTLENERMVTLSERATVLSKRMDYDNVDLATWGYSGLVCYATFETESGQVIELTVGGSDHGGMEEGDTGVLHWSGTKLELFENDRKKAR